MRWWVLLVLAGCYAPSAPAGAPCADGRTCPEGLVCEVVGGADVCILPGTLTPDAASDAGDIDAVPSPTDRDGDGVDDDDDLCPDIADDQHDEDRDAIGDACDPCPTFEQDGSNADGDGLPDSCDPYPTAAGDELALFHGFHEMPPGWSVEPGWSFTGDTATISQAAPTTQFLTAPASVTDSVIMITQLTVGELGPGAGIGIGLGTPLTGVSCGFASRAGGFQLLLYDLDAAVDRAATVVPELAIDEPWAVLLVRTAANTVRCVAANGMTTYTTMEVVDNQQAALQPFVVAQGVDASLLYLLVTTTTSNMSP